MVTTIALGVCRSLLLLLLVLLRLLTPTPHHRLLVGFLVGIGIITRTCGKRLLWLVQLLMWHAVCQILILWKLRLLLLRWELWLVVQVRSRAKHMRPVLRVRHEHSGAL